jgi:hypothetical protein
LRGDLGRMDAVKFKKTYLLSICNGKEVLKLRHSIDGKLQK